MGKRRTYVEVELLSDGSWYATLNVNGRAKAGSGRCETPEDALASLDPNLRLLCDVRPASNGGA